MKMRKVLINLTAAVLLTLLTYGQNPTRNNQEVKSILNSSLPGLQVTVYKTNEVPDSKYLLTTFLYGSIGSNWPYGEGFIIWKPSNKNPLWYYLSEGDYGLLSISWIDFNNDGQRDIFFYAGFEDVLQTYIYVSNIRNNSYFKDNFILAYECKNDYSVVMDLDSDGRPEILDSGYKGNEYKGGNANADNINDLITPDINAVIKAEYYRLASKFDSINFNYGMPEFYQSLNMFLFDPIKIYRINGTKLEDVTKCFPNHLRWRVKLLKEILQNSNNTWKPMIKKVIQYLNHIGGHVSTFDISLKKLVSKTFQGLGSRFYVYKSLFNKQIFAQK